MLGNAIVQGRYQLLSVKRRRHVMKILEMAGQYFDALLVVAGVAGVLAQQKVPAVAMNGQGRRFDFGDQTGNAAGIAHLAQGGIKFPIGNVEQSAGAAKSGQAKEKEKRQTGAHTDTA